MSEFKKYNTEEFEKYITSLNISRGIKLVQLHHTYVPGYKQFTGNNHIQLQSGMRNYHINTNGWSDIAQHFTIFPDGVIVTGRSMEMIPAGIKGANAGAICIECVGNFDAGGDVMRKEQRDAIVSVVKILTEKFSLQPENAVVYHGWWTAAGKKLGDYTKGKSAKTCPGTNFFGGNTRKAFEENLLPLIADYGKKPKKMLETANDITWELNHTYFPIDDVDRFKKVLDEAKKNNSPLYWGYYKLVNRINIYKQI